MSERNTIIMAGRSDSVTFGGDGTIKYGRHGVITVVPTYRADNQLPENVVTINANGTGHLSVTGAGFELDFEGGGGWYKVDGGTAAFATINGGQGGGVFMGGECRSASLPMRFITGIMSSLRVLSEAPSSARNMEHPF